MVDKKAENYGRGEHSIETDEADLAFLRAEDLLAVFRAPGYQPPVLPVVALELLEITRKPDVEYKQILALVERDPLVAARVLRTAQSPSFATRTPVTSLKEALVRLGMVTLTQLFLEVVTNMRLFRVKGFEIPMEGVRRHSTAVAYIARAVAHATKQSTDTAFLCGLLHDVGMVAGLIAVAKPVGGKVPQFETVWPAIRDCHEQTSELLAKLWRLPPEVVLGLGHHHHFMIEGEPNRMSAALCLADAVASELGAGTEAHVDFEMAARARTLLGITDVVYEELRAYATQVISRLE